MRLVTRGDLDGLTCAVLICLKEQIDKILLVHPQDLTEERVDITSEDIIANLPYHPNCGKWFDHHFHTATPTVVPDEFDGAFAQAPSAARLVYEYYGGRDELALFDELVVETDRLDSADLTPKDVLAPSGWIQLGLTIDSRSGLGAFQSYFHTLVGLMLKAPSADEVLSHPEVQVRCRKMEEQDGVFRQALQNHSRVEDNVVITDFRQVDPVPIGNRFLIYALFPQVNVSVRLQQGPQGKYPIMTLGHSIFDRTCKTNVGELAARYGGGGHRGAASLPLMDDPEQQIQMVVGELKANG
ncbi:MAG: exopolyphosphatase [Acidobacteriota bacterium]